MPNKEGVPVNNRRFSIFVTACGDMNQPMDRAIKAILGWLHHPEGWAYLETLIGGNARSGFDQDLRLLEEKAGKAFDAVVLTQHTQCAADEARVRISQQEAVGIALQARAKGGLKHGNVPIYVAEVDTKTGDLLSIHHYLDFLRELESPDSLLTPAQD